MKDIMISIDTVEAVLADNIWEDKESIINTILEKSGETAKYVFCDRCSKALLSSAKRKHCADCKPLDPTEATHGLYVVLDTMENVWCVCWKDSRDSKTIKSGFQSRDLAVNYLSDLVLK